MLQDPNVERYIQKAIKPLLKRISKLETQVEKLSGGKFKKKKSEKKVPTIPKRIQQRLEKAKKLYPVGTKFTSIFGADDVVTQPKKDFFGNTPATHTADELGSILVQGKYESRMIFDGKWAKIHK